MNDRAAAARKVARLLRGYDEADVDLTCAIYRCTFIYQCLKYVALHSSRGYAIGAKFRQWLDAELWE
eukprot:2532410-Pleurochrysis_carterae.AAC.1